MWYFLVAIQLFTVTFGLCACIWGINGVLTIDRSRRVADRYLLSPIQDNLWFWRNPYAYIEEIYAYHHPFTLKGWFGFRHWFKPWKHPEHTYHETLDSIPFSDLVESDVDRRSAERKHSLH